METKKNITPMRGLHGDMLIPGDKSISHRSVMFSGLGDKAVHITNFLNAADCMSTVSCMRALGVEIQQVAPTELIVHGKGIRGLQEAVDIIDAGNSGTTLRLMMGIIAAQPFITVFTGDSSLRRRPMARVIQPLALMGAQIIARNNNRFLPVTVAPAKELKGIEYQMPVASAQVKSAILLCGMYANGQTAVTEPYTSRDHTERMMETFGVTLHKEGTRVAIDPVAQFISPDKIEVPGDISSAAFWLVAATIIPDSELLLCNVGINPTRTGILDVLQAMGANIQVLNERLSGTEPVADLLVKSADLCGISFGADIMPRLIDEIPIITVAAMHAKGRTVITGAGELRVKETDRLHAIEQELNKFAQCIAATDDGLIIEGAVDFAQNPICDSYDDHRIAMALAIAGAAGRGATIEKPDCVQISYPDFYTRLAELN